VAGLTGSLAPVVFAVAFAAFATAFATAATAATIAAAAFAAAADVAFVAAFVAAFAAVPVFLGIQEIWRGGFRAVFADPQFNTGIDILFTMSVAFVIAVAAASPPVW
jgi:hypothetical protein